MRGCSVHDRANRSSHVPFSRTVDDTTMLLPQSIGGRCAARHGGGFIDDDTSDASAGGADDVAPTRAADNRPRDSVAFCLTRNTKGFVMKVGFIGLGHMGSGMAANLLKAGQDHVVYNRTPNKAQDLVTPIDRT